MPFVQLVSAGLPLLLRGVVAHLLSEAMHLGGLLQDLHHPLILFGSWWGVLLGFLCSQYSLQVISQEELATDEVKQLIAVYDKTIQEKFDVNVHQDSTESNLSFRLYREDE